MIMLDGWKVVIPNTEDRGLIGTKVPSYRNAMRKLKISGSSSGRFTD
jgi:hypothetical protein